jgi:hypothetical protein
MGSSDPFATKLRNIFFLILFFSFLFSLDIRVSSKMHYRMHNIYLGGYNRSIVQSLFALNWPHIVPRELV